MFVLKNIERITMFTVLLFVISPCFFINDIQAATTLQTLRAPSNNLGLVGFWSLDGQDVTTTVTDKSGQNNNGYFIGGATTSAKVMGKVGQALQFNGTTQTVSLASDPIGTNANITVCAWIKPRNTGTAESIIENSKFAFANYNQGESLVISNDGVSAVFSDGAIPLNVWTHACGIRSGSTGTIFVNGSQAGSPGNIGTPVSGSGLAIGGFNSGTNNFGGIIDDVRIYNRALSATDIKRIYNSATARQQASQNNKLNNGLIGLWSFDGADVTTTVTDRSGQNNHGYFIGSATSSAKVMGKIGQGLMFDGDDKVSLGVVSAINNLNTVTICAWVYPKAFSVQYPQIFTNQSGAVGFDFYFNNGKLGTSFGATGGYSYLEVLPTVSANVWSFVCAVQDGSAASGLALYKDGVNLGGTPSDGGTRVSAPSNANYIGNAGAGSYGFNGIIDGVRIYSRALTVSEIKQLYNQGGSKTQSSQNSKSTSGLVGMWSFDGPDVTTTVTDRSGQNNHGYFIGGATSSAKVMGKIGQGLSFPGTNGTRVTVSDHSSISGLSAVTVSTWVNVPYWPEQSSDDCFGSACFKFLVAKSNWASNREYRFRYETGSGEKRLYFHVSGDGSNVLDTLYVRPDTGSYQLPPNKWNHVVGVYDSSTDTGSIYVNGVLADSDAYVTSGLFNGTANLSIGGSGDDGAGSDTDDFLGKIDDVRVYNRALTATEIKQLYNQGK